MKTTKTILMAALLGSAAISVNAQLLNPGFELSREDGSIANWVAMMSIPMPLEGETGTCYADSVFFRTTDAHTGISALELRNIPCYDGIIHGRIFASDDIPAWGPSQPYSDRPGGFSFYYKFFPQGGDGIYYSVILTDAEGMAVANIDTVFFPGATAQYTQLFFPLNYESDNAPARMYMYYSIVGTDGTSLEVHPGSRLILDDITADQGGTTPLSIVFKAEIGALVYPTITNNILHISLPQGKDQVQAQVDIYDVAGRQVAAHNVTFNGSNPVDISVNNFQQGMYIARLVSDKGNSVVRFIRQ